ncbi:hypothetical protein Fot_14583 [Forsythia ovata]|uniref:Uncharacterized protein n=1 Tax=Forsythia ovata TaxID=205694 RepID=A0ABD1W775_9LAMI
MARTKTTTHHPELHRSRHSAVVALATAIAIVVLPTTTPPPASVFSPPPSIVPRLLSPPIPPISGTIPSSSTPQPSVASKASDFADENEEEKKSTNEEDDNLSAEETVFVVLSRAKKGKQKVDECSNVADLPVEHQNIIQPSDIPTSATHPQLFEQSLLHKGNHVFTPLNYKFGTLDAQAQFHKFISNRDFVLEFNVKEDDIREICLVELIDHCGIQKLLGWTGRLCETVIKELLANISR